MPADFPIGPQHPGMRLVHYKDPNYVDLGSVPIPRSNESGWIDNPPTEAPKESLPERPVVKSPFEGLKDLFDKNPVLAEQNPEVNPRLPSDNQDSGPITNSQEEFDNLPNIFA